MLLCVSLVVSAPRALAGDTTGFVTAFVLLRGLQLVLYARARWQLPATRQLYGWYLIFFGAGGALWLSSLAVAGPVRYAFWAAGLLTDAVGALAMLAPRRRVPLKTSHLADRHSPLVVQPVEDAHDGLGGVARYRPGFPVSDSSIDLLQLRRVILGRDLDNL